ncbi:histidine acid phosphatase-like protein [Phyllosticta citribraziliensis]|uniref:Histidine acid phosphatase-like protein n=1 Tax=Phyllosticta citribraziliensis TaxID=989973 RepID=A0ABR1LTC3_9PEZI
MAFRSKTRHRYAVAWYEKPPADDDRDRPAAGTASYQLAWILVVLVSFLTVGIILHSGDHVVVSFQLRPAQIPLERQKAATVAGPRKKPKLTAAMAAKFLNSSVAGAWYPPAQSWINNLDDVINGTGVHGFIFNSSFLPEGTPYGTYNWCNMPHVRAQEYPVASDEYELEYVEVIHRHHKRTPYAANTFPRENYPWSCDDEGLFYHAQPLNPPGNVSAPTYWSVYTSPSNPFAPTSGFNGSCQFPQITRGGLDDAFQHGLDLWSVYGELLSFLEPQTAREQSAFRVTNNVITSQVSSMLIPGFFANASSPAAAAAQQQANVPLHIQPATIDSLEPAYTCSAATALAALYGVGSAAPSSNWTAHLAASSPLFAALDAISGVNASSAAWHQSWDHYFDSLSARLCHAKPLPCRTGAPTDCVSQAQADAVFRLGMWEYGYLYRGAVESLAYAVGGFGVWLGELAASLRGVVDADGGQRVRFRHNTAHDGSMARLLALLQVDEMVWPGMGAEVVFELYAKNVSVPVESASSSTSSSTAPPSSADADANAKDEPRAFPLFSSQPTTTTKKYFLRVLWNGQVLRSSHPALGKLDMVHADAVLAYFDELGTGAKVKELCG